MSRVPGAQLNLQRQSAGNAEHRRSCASGPRVEVWACRSRLRLPGRTPGRRGGGARAGSLHSPSPPRLASGGSGSGGGSGGGSGTRRESSPRGGTRVSIRVHLGPREGGFGVHSARCGGPWVRWNLDARDAGLLRGGPGGAGGPAQGGGDAEGPGSRRGRPGTPSSSETLALGVDQLEETLSPPVWSLGPGTCGLCLTGWSEHAKNLWGSSTG